MTDIKKAAVKSATEVALRALGEGRSVEEVRALVREDMVRELAEDASRRFWADFEKRLQGALDEGPATGTTGTDAGASVAPTSPVRLLP